MNCGVKSERSPSFYRKKEHDYAFKLKRKTESLINAIATICKTSFSLCSERKQWGLRGVSALHHADFAKPL